MFTGIVQQVGRILETSGGAPMRLKLELTAEWPDLALGESVAIDGVCLTVTSFVGRVLHFDVSHETLARTTLGRMRPGGRVNLERALRASDLLGGHIVQGHVDGVGTVRESRPAQGSLRLEIEPPPELLRYMIPLGSIALNGVSLTIVSISESFAVNLVPHTVEATSLGSLKPGQKVNLEVDLVAKYLERLLQPYQRRLPASGGVTEDFLKQQGYL